jgi:magnesium-transporting ATPase (P-type)
VNENYLKVGDIVKVKQGMSVPADGLLVYANGIMSDESAMTGESMEIPKDTFDECMIKIKEESNGDQPTTFTHHQIPSPVVLSGTMLPNGEGYFLICCVGELSAMGKILKDIIKKTEASPLQEKLEAIARDIGKVKTIF